MHPAGPSKESFGCLMRRLLRRHLATLSARPAEEIINLSAYPLNSLGSRVGRALLSSVGQQLHETGCAVLPNFLLPDALAEGVAECERGRARGDVFAETRFHNVYMSADDPKLPADHPIHSFQERAQGYIAHDQLEQSSIFKTLYAYDPLTEFVCKATSKTLYRSADPIACAPISVMEPGAAFPWHFDENDVTLTLMLQPAEHGGTFEFFPNLRSIQDENVTAVAAILNGNRTGVIRSTLGGGDLQIFYGQNSLHRVTSVGAGSRPRYLFAPAWNDVPNLVNTVQRSIGSYGRALDVHRQRESLNGRDGLRG